MKRTDLRDQFQPFADKLADELAALASAHLDSLFERARAYAIDKLRAELEGKADAEEEAGPRDQPRDRQPVPTRKRGRKSRHTRVVADRTLRARDESSPPKRQVCSKCGTPGHNALTCGRESKRSKPPVASAPDVVAKPPPLSSSRSDRFAAIEAAARSRRGE